MRTILCLCLWALGAGALPSSAVELALEENRSQRGNVGYVDMRQLFKAFPETLAAKEKFELALRQGEEQINIRKMEVLRLRHELSQQRIERESLAKAAASAPPPPKPAEKPALNLPGDSTEQAKVEPPKTEAPQPGAQSAANDAITAIDSKIAQKAKDLAQKESSLKDYQASTEKALLQREKRESDILLGRINKAIEETARQAQVSIVVDKSAILYGHKAMDLTDKVLKRLKEAPPEGVAPGT
ncbi:MAG: OmpH family outer membrane protein [Elusimicrobia bacterium]|nr:OmpH family outer membrane protein [Elusimicrobiota bacterium]